MENLVQQCLKQEIISKEMVDRALPVPEDDLKEKRQEAYAHLIARWEYCYCKNCKKIRYSSELEATQHGIRCSKCGGYDLEEPRWVECPYRKGAVKCAAGGKGLVKQEYGYECENRCRFLMP